VSACKCGCKLPRCHEERKVPRHDLTADAERLRHASSAHGPLQFVGPSGVIEEVRGGGWDIKVARFFDGFATVERFEDREFTAALSNRARDAVDVLCSVRRFEFSPVFVVRFARCTNGAVYV